MTTDTDVENLEKECPLDVIKDSTANSTTITLDKQDNMKKLKYPKSVFLIVVTEFCERFSYYGMRAVLTIYMTTMLGFSDNSATTVYHTFLLLCYGLPFFWGIVADSWLGKYHTIVYVSAIFAIGNITLTLSSVTPLNLPAASLSMLGLLLMSIGTGGMKPCVAPLGGDQFVLPQQEKQLQQFFSVFLFSVTVGNMFSTIATPLLRTQIQCFGDKTCYPLAFGIPACLMVCAIVVFIGGKRFYKINKPEGNIALNVFRCVSYALSQKSAKKKETLAKAHWLDYAADKYDQTLINDIKGLLRVLIYYLPIPWFFALYEQLGSRWTLQATRMTGVIGSVKLLPDQMQVSNAILMFIFIPVFETVVYPIFNRCNILKRPLQKMIVGGLLAALSFTVAGIVELQIQHSSAVIPGLEETNLNLVNTLPCTIDVSLGNPMKFNASITADSNFIFYSIKDRNLSATIRIIENSCSDNFKINQDNTQWTGEIHNSANSVQTAIFTANEGKLVLQSLTGEDDVKKSKEGDAKLRIVYSELRLSKLPNENHISKSSIEIDLMDTQDSAKSFLIYSTGGIEATTTHQLRPDTYTILIANDSNNLNGTVKKNVVNKGQIKLDTGGSYIAIIHQDYSRLTDLQGQLVVLTPPNEVHMLWLLPQYVLMAWAEILFIISGMEFSFTEAPLSMKSVLQSCWHMANAAGNIIVIISAQIKSAQVTQFFTFAGLVVIDMIIFAFMASRYKYVSSNKK